VGLLDNAEGLLPVGRRADNLDVVRQAEQHDQSVAHGRLVVGDDDPHRRRTGAGLVHRGTVFTEAPCSLRHRCDDGPLAASRPGGEGPAQEQEPFAHPGEPVPAIGGGEPGAAARRCVVA